MTAPRAALAAAILAAVAPLPPASFAGDKAVSSVPPVATGSKIAVKVAYNSHYNVAAPAVGFTGSAATCTPGTISLAFQEWTISRINFLRAMAGVPGTTTLDSSRDAQQQAGSLMMAANNALSHAPPNNWLCYTAAGATALGQSNLFFSSLSSDSISLYMTDAGLDSVGHRRWILHAAKPSFAVGQAVVGNTHYGALYAFAGGPQPATPNGIPWPPRGHVPMALIPAVSGGVSQRWSFGYPGANFASATVGMTLNGTPLATTVLPLQPGYGDPTVVWTLPAGHVVAKGSVYGVTVSGVSGTGVPASFNYEVRPFDPADPAWEVRGDSNGDSRSDLFWRDSSGGLSWWQMNGASIAASNFYGAGAEWAVADVGDLNGDGRADLVWRRASDGATYLWTLDGQAPAGFSDLGILDPAQWTLAGTGDLDGDGRSDIVWRGSDGSVYAWRMNGAAIASQGVVGNPGSAWSLREIADLNGDGKADLVFRHADGTVYAWFMNGLAVSSGGSVGTVDPAAWTLAGAGDFDGNGKADLLWRGAAGDYYVFLMNGAAIASAGSLGNPGADWTVQSVGDYDGDGKADIVLRNATTGAPYLWTMNGLAVSGGGAMPNPAGTWQVVGP